MRVRELGKSVVQNERCTLPGMSHSAWCWIGIETGRGEFVASVAFYSVKEILNWDREQRKSACTTRLETRIKESK